MLQKMHWLPGLLMLCFVQASAQNPDIQLLRAINLHRPRTLDQPFLDITRTAIPVSLALPLGVTGWALMHHDSLQIAQGAEMTASWCLAAGFTLSLKTLIHRPRPFITYPDIQHLQNDTDGSFPSGHTSVAFSLATSLTLQHRRWYVLVPAWTWAAAVAYSRLDLGMHYPSDVLAGMAIGAGSAWASHWLHRWWQRHLPKEKDYSQSSPWPGYDPGLSGIKRFECSGERAMDTCSSSILFR
ncbi:MAG: phosphatase PAP2 family protein [Thermoflavifilum sp.]|nr:phosphatase PAP2 family protein [Thermoflavifilum sp.]